MSRTFFELSHPGHVVQKLISRTASNLPAARAPHLSFTGKFTVDASARVTQGGRPFDSASFPLAKLADAIHRFAVAFEKGNTFDAHMSVRHGLVPHGSQTYKTDSLGRHQAAGRRRTPQQKTAHEQNRCAAGIRTARIRPSPEKPNGSACISGNAAAA